MSTTYTFGHGQHTNAFRRATLAGLVGRTVHVSGDAGPGGGCGLPWNATGVIVRCNFTERWADDGDGENGPSPYVAGIDAHERPNDETDAQGLGLRLTEPFNVDGPPDDDDDAYKAGEVLPLDYGPDRDDLDARSPLWANVLEEIESVDVAEDDCGGAGVVIDGGIGGGYRDCDGCDSCEDDGLPLDSDDGAQAPLARPDEDMPEPPEPITDDDSRALLAGAAAYYTRLADLYVGYGPHATRDNARRLAALATYARLRVTREPSSVPEPPADAPMPAGTRIAVESGSQRHEHHGTVITWDEWSTSPLCESSRTPLPRKPPESPAKRDRLYVPYRADSGVVTYAKRPLVRPLANEPEPEPEPVEPGEDDYLLSFNARDGYVVGDGVKVLVHADDRDDVIEALAQQMEEDGYWPNVWETNDHGNMTLLNVGLEAAVIVCTRRRDAAWAVVEQREQDLHQALTIERAFGERDATRIIGRYRNALEYHETSVRLLTTAVGELGKWETENGVALV